MKVDLGKQINWTEAIKQMCLGKMCAVTFYGNSRDRYFMMKDSTDAFRIFDLSSGTFTDGYLDADDIMEGVWNECEEIKLVKTLVFDYSNYVPIATVLTDGLYHVKDKVVNLQRGDEVAKMPNGDWVKLSSVKSR